MPTKTLRFLTPKGALTCGFPIFDDQVAKKIEWIFLRLGTTKKLFSKFQFRSSCYEIVVLSAPFHYRMF